MKLVFGLIFGLGKPKSPRSLIYGTFILYATETSFEEINLQMKILV